MMTILNKKKTRTKKFFPVNQFGIWNLKDLLSIPISNWTFGSDFYNTQWAKMQQYQDYSLLCNMVDDNVFKIIALIHT